MEPRQRCPYCGKDFLENAVCRSCGKSVGDENRPLPAGTLLDNQRFRVGRALGSGGFGITYRAWDLASNRSVAVKELFPANSARRYGNTANLSIIDGQKQYFSYALRNFSQEAKTIYQLRNYPEILRLYSCFTQNGTAYYAMEFLDGEDLGTVLKREKSLSWKSMARPVRDVLRTLQILHSNNLIHRDISPDNIIRLQDGSAKLIDFGSARDYENNNRFTTVIKRSFAPPELFLSHGRQRPETDVYLLSGTIYYLLSGGKLPKNAYDRVSSINLKGKDSLVPLAAYSPNAPEYVVEAVERGLSIEADRRFHSANEFSVALFGTAPETGRENKEIRLACTRGRFSGQSFALAQGQAVTLGQGKGNMIAYPEGTRGISHKQCVFFVDNKGGTYIQDTQSRFGTYLNGKRLPPRVWCPLGRNQAVVLGDTGEEYRIV